MAPENLLRVIVKGVYFVATITGPQAVVFLQAEGLDKYVPIYVGLAEAISIDVALRKETTPRPMTHDLMKSVMDSFDVEVEKVLIDNFDEDVFYARLFLKQGGKSVEVDARPSDCIALAVRACADVYIDGAIVEKVGVSRADIEQVGGLEEFLDST